MMLVLFIPERFRGGGGGGGGGTLIYLYYMSNIEAWPIFFLFSGRLTKVMVSDHAAFREVALTYSAC